ncbi:MFS transporter [Streptomyces sp. NPDC046821]|uniref:MFS transporter n=1 Tax=Streptomyces sp. NPDC046821 TaxID=3154702 RepID=UPI0034045397
MLDEIGLTRAHKVILALVMMGGFFDVFEQDSIGIVAPALKSTWHLTNGDIGLLNTATFIALVVGGILGGAIGDLAGRKTLFTFNLAIYSVGGLLCALSPNYDVLLVGRGVVGLGLGGELAIAITLLSELMPTSFRGSAVSMFNVGAGGLGNPLAFAYGFVFMGMFGAALGGNAYSWRWYYGTLALPALLVLYLRRHLPETPRYLVAKGKIDEANRVLSVLESGRLNPKGLLTRDFVSTTEKLAKAQKVRLAEVARGKLGSDTLKISLVTWMCFGAQLVVLTLMPIILVDRGYNIASSLGFTFVMQMGSLAGALVAARLTSRVPFRRIVTIGAVVAFAAALAFGFLSRGVVSTLILGAVFQFFVLLLNTTVWAWIPSLYPTRVRAFGTSLVVNVGSLAMALMPLLGGKLLDFSGTVSVFILVAVMYAVVVFLAPFVPETFGRGLEELHGEV